MNEFKSHVDPSNNNFRRQHSVIDVEAKKLDQEAEDSSTTGAIENSNDLTPFVSKSPKTSIAAPLKEPEYSSNPAIAWFQKQWYKLRVFYSKHKKPINIGLAVVGVTGIIIATWMSMWLINIWNNESSLAGLGQQPSESSIVYASDGTTELFRFFEEENRDVVELDQISENMQQAIIALEDENFYYNESGIPWSNLFGALFKCGITLGDECRGASGLSQQLIKNVKKDNESTVDRKVRELFTAVKLNEETTKEEILALYLNWVPFGRNAYGVEQAANIYFDKSASELDLVESCYLASMVQRPSYFDSGIGNPESQAFLDLEARKNACLSKIASEDIDPSRSTRLIEDEETLLQLQEQEVVFQPRGTTYKYAHFKDYVSREINKLVNEQELLTGGYKIVTTLDPAIQDATEASVAARANEDILGAGANNAAVVVLDGPSSEIRAMVGSLDYNNTEIDGQVNVAISPRQPGSSIKPYVYAASFKQGFYPGTTLLDVPTEFEPGYQPKNFSGTFSGVISIRDSLANSYNIPAVKAAYLSAPGDSPNASEGIGAVFNTATAMGVDFPCIPAADGAVCNTDQAEQAYRSRCGISASLGGCEVSLLSHVNGFNTFAQDGRYQQATPFKQIIDSQGRDIYQERQASSNPVYESNDSALDPLIARQINNVLSDYNARYRAFGNSARRLELEGWTGANAVAAKTGTTNDVKDTWTVGYSPYYSVAVWVGNTDSTPLSQTSSSVGTTSGIWNDVMSFTHQNLEKRGFSTEGLSSIQIDPTTGFPSEGGTRSELITRPQLEKLNAAAENLSKPTEYNAFENSIRSNGTVNYRGSIRINKLDGKLAVEGKTLEENIEDFTFNVLLAEYPKWQSTADAWMEKSPELFPKLPTEDSDQDQVADQTLKPTFQSNLDASKNDVSQITVTAEAQGLDTKTISKIEILIDGTVEASVDNQNNLTFSDISSFTSGSYTVLIRVTDSFNAKTEKTYTSVTFEEAGPEPITQSEISGLSVTCDDYSPGDTTTDCTFELDESVELTEGFRLRIGTNGNTTCSENVSGGINTVTCSGVPIPATAGTYEIKAQIDGSSNYVNTASSYEVD